MYPEEVLLQQPSWGTAIKGGTLTMLPHHGRHEDGSQVRVLAWLELELGLGSGSQG